MSPLKATHSHKDFFHTSDEATLQDGCPGAGKEVELEQWVIMKCFCPVDTGKGNRAQFMARYHIEEADIKMMAEVKVFPWPHPPVEPAELCKEDLESDMYTRCMKE